MSPLDDTELTAQLRRRSGDARVAMALADQIRERSVNEGQVAARPWDRWRWPTAPRRSVRAWRTAAVVLSGALVLVLASALTALAPTRPPAASVPRSWLLTNEQLIEVAHAAARDPSNVGRAVVAEVRLARWEVDCAVSASSCAPTYSLLGSVPAIDVTGLPDAPTCPPPGSDCSIATATTGRMAVIIGRGTVSFLGWVRLGPDDGAWSPGSVSPVMRDPISLQGRMVVVDGWLTGYGGPISCPAARAPSEGISPAEEGYGCGDAAWITSQRYVSTTLASAGIAVHPPGDGLRVQNGAYEAFALGPTADAEPRHGLYLIEAVGPIEQCFDCASPGVGRLVARIDPIELPLQSAPAFPTASPLQASPPDAPVPGWTLTQAQLVAAVEQATTLGVGVGRVVVADVTFELGGDCRGTPVTLGCYPVVKGSDPPIRLLNATTSHLCPPAWFCVMESQPAVPADGPFALRITGDGTLEWVGWVKSQNDGSIPWSFDAFHERLGHLQPSELDAYELYAVDGWISGAAFIPRCLLALPLPDPRFDCGQVAWLTGTEIQPNALPTDGWSLTTPAGSVRLPNGGYAAFAPSPGPFGPSMAPEPRHAVLLVQPVIPAVACLFCDGELEAVVVARLDPPTSELVPIPVLASPSPDPMAAYAVAYATKFEEARATGDWTTAWALLSPATRAVFGSVEAFATVEAAYNATGATAYQIAAATKDPDYVAESVLATRHPEIIRSTAWFVTVSHPNVDGASAGFEGLVIASSTDGEWHVWIDH